MSLASFYQADRTAISFELFPPKTDKGKQSMYRHLEQLMVFKPDYVTCTYGAGGSTREKTLDIVCEVKNKFSIPVASCLLYTSPSPRDQRGSRMPSSA